MGKIVKGKLVQKCKCASVSRLHNLIFFSVTIKNQKWPIEGSTRSIVSAKCPIISTCVFKITISPLFYRMKKGVRLGKLEKDIR